jgi:hypothetical protein
MPKDSPLQFKILRNTNSEAPELRSDFARHYDHAHMGCGGAEHLPICFGNSRRRPAGQEKQRKTGVER